NVHHAKQMDSSSSGEGMVPSGYLDKEQLRVLLNLPLRAWSMSSCARRRFRSCGWVTKPFASSGGRSKLRWRNLSGKQSDKSEIRSKRISSVCWTSVESLHAD